MPLPPADDVADERVMVGRMLAGALAPAPAVEVREAVTCTGRVLGADLAAPPAADVGVRALVDRCMGALPCTLGWCKAEWFCCW